MKKKELKIISENCCETAAAPNLSEEQAERAKKVFGALADPTRLAILNMLARSEGEVCVCDITDFFAQHQPTISHHLKILREAGLITGDKRGKWVYYTLVRKNMESVKALVDEVMGAPVLV